LLIAEEFRDASGHEWRVGDRAPLARRAVRQAALERPARFAMEFETVEVDMPWLRELDASYEERVEEVKRRRGREAEEREKALRAELKAQDVSQPELERRYAQQEKERAERAKRAREEREREQIERELEFGRIGHD
jgi:phage protein D